MWIGKFALLGSGETEWIDLGASAVSTVTGAAYLNGAAYDPEYDALLATTEAVDPSDAFIGGFRYRADGALRVVNADAGVPAGANTNQGLALSEDGQLCYVTLADTAYSLNGVAVDGVRRVYAAPLAFALEFADLGAGVVDTTEAITGATPTFTRATAATTVLSTGLIGAVASGDPRSYYDPTSLTYLGYLAEGARTNLLLSSEDLRSAAAGNPITAWTNTDTTVTVAGTTAPDGAATGNLLVEGTAGTALLTQAVTATADVNYAVSRFIKRGNTDWVQLIVNNGVNNFRAWFNLATGVAGTTSAAGTGASVGSSIKAYPNGWYRCTTVGSVGSAATSISSGSLSAASDGGVRVNNATRYEWGTQFENNVSFASSYIPTTTAAVARNADVLTYPTTGWLNAAAGTCSTEATPLNPTTSAGEVVSFDDGTSNERMLQNRNVGISNFQVNDGGVAQVNLSSGTWAFNTTGRGAMAYALNNSAFAFDGTLVGTDTACTIPTVTTFRVGCNSSSAFQFFGPIRRVAYYAARLSNATLQGLTNG